MWSRAADGGAAGPLWLLLATLDTVHLHVVLALLAVAYLSWKVRLAHQAAAMSVACPPASVLLCPARPACVVGHSFHGCCLFAATPTPQRTSLVANRRLRIALVRVHSSPWPQRCCRYTAGRP